MEEQRRLVQDQILVEVEWATWRVHWRIDAVDTLLDLVSYNFV